MNIVCDKCEAIVPAGNIDLQRGIAKCADCDNIFGCREQLDGLAGDAARSTARLERSEVELPRKMKLYRKPDGLRIVRRWFGAQFVFMIVFCCFWDGFMIVWFGIAISQKQWIMAAFGTLHALVGAGLSYFTLCGIANSTTITVYRGLLEIKHGPLPVPGNQSLPASTLTQLYSKEKVSHSRNGTSVSYEVRARTTDRGDIKLLGHLEREDQALFIEQQIEHFLEIKDEPVRSEVAR